MSHPSGGEKYHRFFLERYFFEVETRYTQLKLIGGMSFVHHLEDLVREHVSYHCLTFKRNKEPEAEQQDLTRWFSSLALFSRLIRYRVLRLWYGKTSASYVTNSSGSAYWCAWHNQPGRHHVDAIARYSFVDNGRSSALHTLPSFIPGVPQEGSVLIPVSLCIERSRNKKWLSRRYNKPLKIFWMQSARCGRSNFCGIFESHIVPNKMVMSAKDMTI